MEILALKMKMSVLWIFKDLAALAFLIIMLMEEGVLVGIMAGEMLGMQIGPEVLLVGAIESWVPLVMAFLSLTLKDSINRWANIIVGIVYTALSLISLVDALSAHGILMWVSGAVATALIVWYAWKWPKQEA
jgi:hypothetical protein